MERVRRSVDVGAECNSFLAVVKMVANAAADTASVVEVFDSEGDTMASDNDAPVDLYIAAYADENAAQADWDTIQELAKDGTITVDGLVLVSRGMDGKINVKDDAHTTGHGAAWGVAGGLPSVSSSRLRCSSRVSSAQAWAPGSGLISHAEKTEIKDEVADDLPHGSSAIVALFDEQWAADVSKALPKADKVSKHDVDKQSAEKAKAAAAKA